MIKTSCPKREMENMRGGKGLLHATDLTTVEECYGHVRLFCHMVLDPGVSIGYHAHEGETEFFYILSGKPVANDNGTMVEMVPGQVLATGHGDGHALENPTAEPVEFIAMIVVE